MTTEAKQVAHTPGLHPLPWRVNERDNTVGQPLTDIVDATGDLVFGSAIEPDEAIIAFIVQAVNAEAAAPDLLKALKDLCERFDTFEGGPFVNPLDSPWAKARAALKRAGAA